MQAKVGIGIGIAVVIGIIVVLVASNTQSSDVISNIIETKARFDNSNVNALMSSADEYKGSTISVYGYPSNLAVVENTYIFQLDSSTQSSTVVLEVKSQKPLQLPSDKDVCAYVKGVVVGSKEMPFGYVIPRVEASDVKIMSLNECRKFWHEPPWIKTIDTNEVQEKDGIKVILQWVGFAQDRTVMHVKVENNKLDDIRIIGTYGEEEIRRGFEIVKRLYPAISVADREYEAAPIRYNGETIILGVCKDKDTYCDGSISSSEGVEDGKSIEGDI
ncbi:MAG: hypothetical protein KatS3mg003_0723 [Candidatus Nitrosocaldaceae archaeon]|nr:MAG: hypothetical protein KatS3mg003_0723 [Candidatus Nitrosocaldaceae archaeon]